MKNRELVRAAEGKEAYIYKDGRPMPLGAGMVQLEETGWDELTDGQTVWVRRPDFIEVEDVRGIRERFVKCLVGITDGSPHLTTTTVMPSYPPGHGTVPEGHVMKTPAEVSGKIFRKKAA